MSFYSKFADYYEEIFPFSQGVADFMIDRLSGSRYCLDVGCGSGHYANYLAARGYKVTGIDLDVEMIAYARQHYTDIEFHTMDMRDILVLGRSYDAIYCIGNSGAHLTQAAFGQYISDLRTMLNPGGIWVLQLMNWDYVLNQTEVSFPDITTEDNLTFYRRYQDISPDTVQFQTKLVSGKTTIFEDAVPLYPIVSEKLSRMHSERGFHLIEHYGSYAGTIFDPDVFSASIYVFRATE